MRCLAQNKTQEKIFPNELEEQRMRNERGVIDVFGLEQDTRKNPPTTRRDGI